MADTSCGTGVLVEAHRLPSDGASELLHRHRFGAATVDHVGDVFPSDLLTRQTSGNGHRNEQQPMWWLAHTRPRQEKAAAAALWTRSVGYYLPLVLRKSLTRGRLRTARIPLFPGYVFVSGNDEDRIEALKTNRLIAMRPVPDGELLQRQLWQFAELIAAGAPLVRESRLEAGEHVRIKVGPFRGTEGVVLRRNGKSELLIAVDFLQQGASLEIDDCMLEPV